MMQLISTWFVQNPLGVALVSGVFFVFWWLTRGMSATARPHALLWAATAWLLWAAWEWAVTSFSPEADIRVDLLLIIPLVLLASVLGLLLAFWPRRG